MAAFPPDPRRAVRMVFAGCCWMCASVCHPAAARAEEPGAAAPGRAVSSAQRRFIVAGLDTAANVTLAIAAEEAAIRLETLLGTPIPLTRNQPIVIAAREEAETRRGRVRKMQGWTERGLTQRVELVNPRQVDQEDVLEALTWLLLNRYAIARQSGGDRRTRPAEAPEWVSAGLAQNLYPELRARNRRLILDQWSSDRFLSFQDISKLIHLPAGRWSEKAYAGVAVDWLLSQPANAPVWPALFSAWSRRAPISPEALAELILGRSDPRELEKHWELWVARQLHIHRAGDYTRMEPDRLRELFLFSPEEWTAVTGLAAEGPIRPGDLIPLYRAEWMPRLVQRWNLRVQGQAVGAEPDFLAVLARYDAFFKTLAHARPRGLARWTHRPARVEGALRLQLDQAEQSLSEYRKHYEQRLRFVDEAERASEPPSAGSDADLRRRMPRSELQRYVDTAEEAPAPAPAAGEPARGH